MEASKRGKLTSFSIDGFNFSGISSGSAETVIMVKPLGIVFDIGKCPEQAIHFSTLLLTHGHLDHIAGLIYYIAQRKLMHMKICTVYVPAELIEPLTKIIKLWEEIEDVSYNYILIGTEKDKEYPISQSYIFRTTMVNHRVPALGYCILEYKKKLKKRYVGLSSEEIVMLKSKGLDITETVKVPRIFYGGDSTLKGIMDNELACRSDILFLEATFISENRDIKFARKWGHTHIEEIFKNEELFNNNKHIIIHHISRRYSVKDIMDKINKECPIGLKRKIKIVI